LWKVDAVENVCVALRWLMFEMGYNMRWALAALIVKEILHKRRWAADMGALAALDMVAVPAGSRSG
jgi:hypothetical protein